MHIHGWEEGILSGAGLQPASGNAVAGVQVQMEAGNLKAHSRLNEVPLDVNSPEPDARRLDDGGPASAAADAASMHCSHAADAWNLDHPVAESFHLAFRIGADLPKLSA